MGQEAPRPGGVSERIAALTPEQRALLAERLKGNEWARPAVEGIPRRAGVEPPPLSFAQRRLWFLNQLEPDSPSYKVPLALRLAGRLDPRAMEASLQEIVSRHEVLRTSFSAIRGEPVQVISRPGRVELPVFDLSDVPPAEREDAARQLATREVRRPFALDRGPLLRCLLIRLGAQEHILLLTAHHIVFDGWSTAVLLRELGSLYEANSAGRPAAIPDLPIQYADFAVWQRERLRGGLLERQLSYWKLRLADLPPPLELPTDRPRPAVPTRRGARQSVALPGALTEGVRELSRREGVTMFMTLLAAFQALLCRYTNRPDIAVGTPVANRTSPELEGLIGFFANTLVLRADFSGDPTFRQLLGRVREAALGAYEHQDVPFERLVEELQPERSLTRPPLFNLTFALQHATPSTFKLHDLTASTMKVDAGASKFDLSVTMSDEPGGLRASARYSTDLFDGTTVARMLGHFQVLLEAVAADPRQPLSRLPLLTAAERRRQLVEWNDTATEYPRRRCIHQLFEGRVAERPEGTAIVFEGRALTYAELNRRANRLAHHLRKRGVGPEVKVGVALESLPEIVVALLGVLKAGGAYVPLDSRYPRERLRWMLRDAAASVLLTEAPLAGDLTGGHEAEVILLDRDWETIAREGAGNPDGGARSENTACVLYTSGSTGTPKGISVTHRAVARLVVNTSYVRLAASDRVAQVSNLSFDAALFEIWGALLNGARLVGLTRERSLSPRDLAAAVREQGISVMFLTTALFTQVANALPSAFGSLRCLLFGGEAAQTEPVREVLRHGPPQQLLHMYGPTESTTFASWHPVEGVPDAALRIPVGRPLSNTQIYLLDDDLRPAPVGVPGEVYIGGDGLARGYLNRPALTAEKFIPDPFGGEPGARLYRTGDVARYLPDGNIDFLERRDSQVKIRGHRIELGEIEVQLLGHPAVREAAVLAREVADNDRRLTAYVVCHPPGGADEQPPSSATLRAHLQGRLPPYMVPSEFVRLGALPLTPNGKVDRKALASRAPERPDAETPARAPRDLLEHQLTQIWEDLLGVRPVGVRDNFFELGGHSLLAVSLMDKIEHLCGLKLPLATLFEEATVEHLVKSCLEKLDGAAEPPLVAIHPGGSRRPFFFLHGDYNSGGFYCANLARHLGPDQPFYVLPSWGGEGCAPTLTIEEIASRHLKTLREVQPEGPYLLGGFCHGGLAAFEMSRRLSEQGQKVDLLVLIHASARNARPRRFFRHIIRRVGALVPLTPEQELGALMSLRYFVNGLEESRGVTKLSFVLNKARKALARASMRLADRFNGRAGGASAGNAPEGVSPKSYSRHSAELTLRYQWATYDYVPQEYRGRVTLFWPEQESAGQTDDPTRGWGRVAEEVLVHSVPGDHLTSVTRYHQAVAEQLRVCLRECGAHPSDERSVSPPGAGILDEEGA